MSILTCACIGVSTSERCQVVLELGTYAAEVPVHISHMELGRTAYSIIS